MWWRWLTERDLKWGCAACSDLRAEARKQFFKDHDMESNWSTITHPDFSRLWNLNMPNWILSCLEYFWWINMEGHLLRCETKEDYIRAYVHPSVKCRKVFLTPSDTYTHMTSLGSVTDILDFWILESRTGDGKISLTLKTMANGSGFPPCTFFWPKLCSQNPCSWNSCKSNSEAAVDRLDWIKGKFSEWNNKLDVPG